MKVIILKGRFTCNVEGSQVTITCNVCNKSDAEYDRKSPVPGKDELAQASGMMGNKKEFRHAKPVVDRQLASASPNAMAAMIVAPVKINGRPAGCQPIVCFYCCQAGLINIEAERPGTASFGFQPQSLNGDPRIHARRRVMMTLIPLVALDYLVQNNLVSPAATVVCAGASIQCQGRKSNGADGRPRQDAHQTLRELSIDGIPLYQRIQQIPGLSQVIKNVVIYCHGVISHLDAQFNETDCLVEHAITVEMIDLAHLVLNGTLRRSSGPHNEIFARLLWRYLMARYYYAIQMALIRVEPVPLRDTLLFYKSVVEEMAAEGPPDFRSGSLDDLCDSLKGELRLI